jgi:transposase-like protein
MWRGHVIFAAKAFSPLGLRLEPGQITEFPIRSIRVDGETQGLVAVDPKVIDEYVGHFREGAEFPPVRVWFDGTECWLSDGFQRVEAAKRAGLESIRAEVLYGCLSDAQWDSYGANSKHGSRRTSEDAKAILGRALCHSRSSQMSNYELAKHLNIPESTLRRWRKQISTSHDVDDERVVARGGREYSIKTAKIGKQHPARRLSIKSVRQIRGDLFEMKERGSPDARRALTVVSNWIMRGSSSQECLVALELLFKEFRKSN